MTNMARGKEKGEGSHDLNNSAALLLNPDFLSRICLPALQTREKESLENSAPWYVCQGTRKNTTECSSYVLLPSVEKPGRCKNGILESCQSSL